MLPILWSVLKITTTSVAEITSGKVVPQCLQFKRIFLCTTKIFVSVEGKEFKLVETKSMLLKGL